MKSLFSILPLSIAILLIAALSIMPHHHHKERVCMAVEECEEDNTYNYRHTKHETTQDDDGLENGCAADTLYYLSADEDNKHSLVHSFCLLVSYVLYIPDVPTTKAICPWYALCYESAYLGLCCGLRAPPSLS